MATSPADDPGTLRCPHTLSSMEKHQRTLWQPPEDEPDTPWGPHMEKTNTGYDSIARANIAALRRLSQWRHGARGSVDDDSSISEEEPDEAFEATLAGNQQSWNSSYLGTWYLRYLGLGT